MRNNNSRTAMHQILKSLLNKSLTSGIECARSLIKYHNRRVLIHRTSNRESLTLSARELTPSISDIRLVALSHTLYKLINVGDACRLLNISLLRIVCSEGYIVSNRIIKENWVLINIPN